MSTDRQYATLHRAAAECGVSYDTLRNRVVRGQLRVIRTGGKTGHVVDLAEAREVLARTRRYGDFGPDARVVDMSNVVLDESQVLR